MGRLGENKSSDEPKTRAGLVDESGVQERIKQESRDYQKQQRAKHLQYWNDEKAKIDGLTPEGLEQYLNDNKLNSDLARAGMHTIKINPYELALIKLAMSKKGARSSKALFVDFCKSILKIK
ncbi:hypothetical protein JK628_23200 (plasmid) [Shewanella sp. KX20019]|uniref:hypothetical protein n=1 Tax=Shewanella sp. KX20019 TaxID=2803864 RepID=UPI0019263481|nr:hypothetical protein [Shewanella sp. KX20019]QQX82691.1 hypothetical protein JK628_23200 [Shewanella sp. KX20019]